MWRNAENPILHRSTGKSLAMLAVDEMHTMHIGVCVCAARFACCLWAIVDSDVWNLGCTLTNDAWIRTLCKCAEWCKGEKDCVSCGNNDVRSARSRTSP